MENKVNEDEIITDKQLDNILDRIEKREEESFNVDLVIMFVIAGIFVLVKYLFF